MSDGIHKAKALHGLGYARPLGKNVPRRVFVSGNSQLRGEDGGVHLLQQNKVKLGHVTFPPILGDVDTDYPWKVSVKRNEDDTAWVATVSDLSYLQDSVANTAEVAVTDVDEEITITEAKRLVLEWNAAAENWTLKAVNNAGFQPTEYNESIPSENTYSRVTIATFHKPDDDVLLERQYVRNILAQCWIADSGNAAFFARPI